MKTEKFYQSIVFKLIAAVVIIFIAMITITNYLINQKQIEMTEIMLRQIEEWMPSYKNSIVVTVNNAHLQSSADFKIYTFIVTGIVILTGSLIFAFIITKILNPLKDLQKNIAKVDIDRPETFSEKLLIEDGSSEIVDLSESFNSLMDRVYKDYKKQKDFSANVAHELRTPVAVMKAQVDVFKRKEMDDDTWVFVEKMDKSLEKLTNLINSVLIFSKNQEPHISKVCINSLIDEILFDLEDKIASKDLRVNFEKNTDLCINSDDALLQRLLFNIIENSIKYNIQGGFISIETKVIDDKLKIEIADSGIGMTDEQKKKIFDLFYQADKSRNGEGFGIGLSLSKQIADSLGAKIEVLDNEPKGSKFILTFK
ncbi:sensor histidine kinase [Anaerococcus urinomassiliensis]|uniref:sensor histidine kinase n=1 Tax=Anaerococcus urinomassiliensis TaxID=1745712 RepID=UPI00093B2784|nr:HAMP domain-containing sensor histidine kinase [Anaerococcus urinomassiliensis]